METIETMESTSSSTMEQETKVELEQKEQLDPHFITPQVVNK
jgi:hypothetical protein